MFGKSMWSGFNKGIHSGFTKGTHNLAHILDNPIVGAAASSAAPEVGAGVQGARKLGLLERAKRH